MPPREPLQARPTVYRGVAMRSRLEATFAAYLDEILPGAWQYEPFAFASPAGQYLPDFAFVARHLSSSPQVYVEVRPTIERAFAGMGRMAIVWESEPAAWLLVAVPLGEIWLTFSATGPDRTFRIGWATA